ncbi:aspartate/glutamate racemase family protein [Sedimentitalea sp. CAU 1593]|uniref:Aspartate/glutamate racemase family protein n=2 Tax=Sedimentitalea arenosa TaxID=2798803 RepID=A0A8J7IYL3_9RHOB|nr:aspartate/glutamate racemase family protein [Arenibacterium arenosum]MBJ6373557.1 aspartate/glutamate racemase family protein [Arenibacterium arenosum]
MKVRGGRALYGASVGILMLEARFPRIPGDMGNATTWPFPVHYKVVRDASPERVVRQGAEGLLDAFIDAARALVTDGVDGITTNCGFLSLFQDELAAAVPVPVVTSSLMQVGMVDRLLGPGRRAGILTISGSTLTPLHLARAHVPEGTPVGSTEGGREFTRAILSNETEMDIELARQDNVEAALALQAAHPDLGAIVLECTNMGPYAADIAAATGLPVHSIIGFVSWFQSGLCPPRFPCRDNCVRF